MYGDEFSKIKAAVESYGAAQRLIDDVQEKRKQLKLHAEQNEPIKLAFIGNTGTIEIHETMQADLRKWLDERFQKVQDDAARFQRQLTCPAGTNDR